MSNAEAIVRAQRKIMEVLAELEIATGEEVDWIGITSADQTLIHDPKSTTLRSVAIRLEHRAEKRWNL